ncbi:BppU family phage baseplate upper protein [Enterococcus faecium]
MFKINESIIVIQAEATSPNRTDVVFWSHDRGTAKLRIKLVRKNGIPQSLPEGTTVPIRLIFRSATAEGGYGKHDYLATVEDPVNGIVSIVLEDNILGYVGTVEGSVYIDFPNDRSLDTAGRFTFDIKRSPIDDSTPELEDYYFNGFSQTIDKIEKILADGKLEIEQKISESETQIDAKLKDTNDKIAKANQDVATLNTNIDKANDRIDQTNQQIGDLGKLKKMYSNSIDFGDYDYSGNPNLITNLSYSDISTSWTQEGSAPIPPSSDLVIDNGDSFTVDLSKFTGNLGLYFNNLPRPLVGKNYAWSIELKSEEPLAGNVFFVRPVYTNASGILSAYAKPINTGATTEMTRYSTTYTNITDIISNSKCQSLQMYFPKELPRTKVTIKYNIKVEQVLSTSDTATPYQPNLLVEPYYLSKTVLGKNIRRTDVGNSLPRTTTEYRCYVGNIEGYYEANQDYVITMKATKPATQTFGLYLLAGSQHAGNLMPVEGLTDTWQLNFRPTKEMIDAGVRNQINIFQVPQSTKGEVKIEWIKLEKGDIRTPNISQFKYFGEGLKDSNNPNNYSWDVTPEYTEKGLNDTVSLTEPETVLGLKNFKDGAQIDGVDVATVKNLGSVLQSGSGLTTIQSDKQSAFDEFSYEFERIGDRVFFHARVKTNSTTAVASHVNLLEIPLGFQLPIGGTIGGIPLSVVQWTTPQGEISALVITDLTGKQVVKFATNRVGNHYISGEWRTADSYPEKK